MTSQRLTDRSELTGIATGDFIHVVDVSDTTDSAAGTSKKAQVGNLPFDAAGTAAAGDAAHLGASDPHPQYLTPSEANAAYDALGAASAAVASHAGAVDPHPQYLTQSEGDGRYILLSVLSQAVYLTTMLPGNTGTQNATALTADITAAAGIPIIVPPLNYTLNAVDVSSKTVRLKMILGGKLIPDGSNGLYRSGTMLHFTNCTLDLDGFYSDGQNNGSPICLRADNGTFNARNVTIINYGPRSGQQSTTGVYGFFLKGCTDIRIDGWTSSGMNDVRATGSGISNAYGDQPGTVRHILFYNCGRYHFTNGLLTAGDQSQSEDCDLIQFLDDRATVSMTGTIDTVFMRYNGSVRRCLKYQGGYHYAHNVDIRKDSTFTAVSNSTAISGAANNGSGLIRLTVASTTNIITGNTVVVSGVTGTTEANGTWPVTVIDGTHLDLQGSTFTNAYVSGGTASASTDIGENCLNCIDWAGNLSGFLRLTDSYVDATGFAIGIGETIGSNAPIQCENVKLIGSQLNYIRHNLEHDTDENSPTIGFYTGATDVGSGMINCEIVGWCKASTPSGAGNFFRICTFDDPRDYVFETGNTGKTGFDFIGNKVITRTPGNLSSQTRGARLNDVRGVRIYDNTLEQQGNTTHATTFIACLSASATGWSRGNTAPTSPSTTPISVGSSGIIDLLSNNAISVRVSGLIVDAEWNFGGSYAIWNFLRKQSTISGTTQTINQFACKEMSFHTTSSSAVTVTIPTSIPAGTRFSFFQRGTGQITFQGDGTMNVRNADGHTKSAGQYARVDFEVVATNECVMSGKTAA